MWSIHFFRKNLNKTFLLVALFGSLNAPLCAQNDLLPAYPNEISYRNGTAYFGGAPFTGLLVEEGSNTRLGEFRIGKRVGLHTTYFRPGVKQEEGSYDSGRRIGVHSFWHPNEQRKVEYTYVNDRIVDGRYTVLDEQGARIRVEVYAGGEKVAEGTYQGDDLFEPTVRYHPGGKVKEREGQLKNGKPHGEWTEWYADGKKKKEETYLDGELHGTVTTNWPTGEKKREEQYEHGRLVRTVYANDVDPTTSIRYAMTPGSHLFMALRGALEDTIFVMVRFSFPTGNVGSSGSAEAFKEHALGALENRMDALEGAATTNYLDRRAGFSIEFSDPRSEAVYDNGRSVNSGSVVTVSTQVPAGYRGKGSIHMKIKDQRSSIVHFDGMLSATSAILPDKGTAMATAPRQIRQEIINKAYAALRIKVALTTVVEMDRRGNAKRVEIDCGAELALAKGFQFNIYRENDVLEERSIGIVEVIEVGPGTSVCKVIEGESGITQQLNSGAQLIAVSVYKL